MLRGRVISTSYEYDDTGRILRSYADPAWTAEDHDLMLALSEHESSLCPGCGQPKAHAWHPDQEGWFDLVEFTCHSCTKVHGTAAGVYKISTDTWPAGKPWPEWPDVMPTTTDTTSLLPE